MKNNQGFIGIIIAILAALIIAGGAGYLYIQHQNKVASNSQIDFGTNNPDDITYSNTGTTTVVNSNVSTSGNRQASIEAQADISTGNNTEDMQPDSRMIANDYNAVIKSSITDFVTLIANEDGQNYSNACTNGIINTSNNTRVNSDVNQILINQVSSSTESSQITAGIKCYSSKSAVVASVRLNPGGIDGTTTYCEDANGYGGKGEMADASSFSCIKGSY